MIHETNLAGARTEGDEFLAKELDPQRRAARLELR